MIRDSPEQLAVFHISTANSHKANSATNTKIVKYENKNINVGFEYDDEEGKIKIPFDGFYNFGVVGYYEDVEDSAEETTIYMYPVYTIVSLDSVVRQKRDCQLRRCQLSATFTHCPFLLNYARE